MRTLRPLIALLVVVACGGRLGIEDPDSTDADIADSWRAPLPTTPNDASSDGTAQTMDASTIDGGVFDSGLQSALVVTKSGGPSTAGRIFEDGTAGIDCGSTCSRAVPIGASVTLHAEPGGGYVFDRWTSGPCAPSEPTCTLPPAVLAGMTVSAQFRRANYVFVSEAHTPNQLVATGTPLLMPSATDPERLVAGADAVCAAEASAANLDAPTATWRSWISRRNADAIDRVAGSRGWVRPDGAPFVDQMLAVTPVMFPPTLTAAGTLTYDAPLTGTSKDGTFAGANCLEGRLAGSHRTIVGSTFGGTGMWTLSAEETGGALDCTDTPRRHYCLQTGINAPIVLPAISGRRIFVSAVPMAITTGIAKFDAACKFDADVAGLSGSYRAMVPPANGTTTRSRFALRGVPVLRTDGVRVARTDNALLEHGEVDAAIERRADGSILFNVATFTGSSHPNAPATNTCNNWSSTDSLTEFGGVSFAGPVALKLPVVSPGWCGTMLHVYCLEE